MSLRGKEVCARSLVLYFSTFILLSSFDYEKGSSDALPSPKLLFKVHLHFLGSGLSFILWRLLLRLLFHADPIIASLFSFSLSYSITSLHLTLPHSTLYVLLLLACFLVSPSTPVPPIPHLAFAGQAGRCCRFRVEHSDMDADTALAIITSHPSSPRLAPSLLSARSRRIHICGRSRHRTHVEIRLEAELEARSMTSVRSRCRDAQPRVRCM